MLVWEKNIYQKKKLREKRVFCGGRAHIIADREATAKQTNIKYYPKNP